MQPESSDQPPPWYRFTLAKLLLAVTVISLLFGIAGVPETIYIAGWLAAMAIYFVLVERVGWVLAFFALMTFIVIFAVALQAIHFSFL